MLESVNFGTVTNISKSNNNYTSNPNPKNTDSTFENLISKSTKVDSPKYVTDTNNFDLSSKALMAFATPWAKEADENQDASAFTASNNADTKAA